MAQTEWRMKGQWLKNCNCDAGCPCDFNARPTHGHCEGMVGMHIEEGHFGATDLSGLRWAVLYHWPGPLHEGNGTILPILDERADARQREGLLSILSGQGQEGTFFHIVSIITSTVLEPRYLPLEFGFDLEARKAHMSARGLFETVSEPIRNPVTGMAHRIQVHMPDGFEYRVAEIASARGKAEGDITFDLVDSHSSMALVDQTPAGPAG
jgi:hypothetical protein